MDIRNLLNNRATSARRPAHNPALFIFTALWCAAALALTYWAFVRTTTGQLLDESAFKEAELLVSPQRLPILQFLDSLPLISVFLAGIVMLAVSIYRRSLVPAVIAFITFAGANVTTQVLKRLLLDRPDRGVITLDFNSLPSGHTTLAASAAAVIFLLATPRWRPAAAFIGGTYAVLAGAATVVNLWHRPADVVASFLVVAAWTLLGGLAMMRLQPEWNRWQGRRHGSGAWVLLSWFAGLLSLVACAGSYLYARFLAPASTAADPLLPYFWWGLTLIIGVGYVLWALAIALFNQQTGD